MSAGTLSPPANGQATKAEAPLWGELDIPLIVGTGEFGQGKSLAGLTICPGPQTLCYDFEGGVLSYRSLDFDHVDMATELLKKHPSGFTNEQRYLWWREDAITRGRKGGRAGRYRVLMVDPVSEIEDGLAEHLRKNITKYGLTQAQADRSPALFWGVMKKEWKLLLDTLRSYFETTYLVVHMRDVFKGGVPTGKREPKGKETLFELASLFLEFEREQDKKGNVAAVPSATVLKSRLAKTVFFDGELKILPVLPPRLPVATPRAIRDYIATPPDYEKLKAAERIHEKEMTEEERLRLQAQIATSNAEAAAAEVAKLDRIEKINQAAAAQAAARTPAPDMAAEHAQATRERAANGQQMISPARIEQIKTRLIAAFGSLESDAAGDFLGRKLAEFGAAGMLALTDAQGDGIESELYAMISARGMAELAEKRAVIDASPDPHNARNGVATPAGQVATEAEPPRSPAVKREIVPQKFATDNQLAELRNLMPLAFREGEDVESIIFGILREIHDLADENTRFSDLTIQQADSMIRCLQERAEALKVPFDVAPVEKASPEQLERLEALSIKAGWSFEAMKKWLDDHGLEKFGDATREQIQERIDELAKASAGFSQGTPGN
jgi:hypothetical protein